MVTTLYRENPFDIKRQHAYMERFGATLYSEKPYKRDSPIPSLIHTQESGPGDRTLNADIPYIRTTL